MKKKFVLPVAVMLAVIIQLGGFVFPVNAQSISEIGIRTGSSTPALPQIGDTVIFNITISNNSTETVPTMSVVETNDSGIFNHIAFVENSVEVNGVPTSYVFNTANNILTVSLIDVLAGEERIITFAGVLTAEGSFSHAGRLSALGSIRLWASSAVIIVNPRTFAVAYDANSGIGTITDENSPYLPGAVVTVLSGSSLQREGFTFAGWALNAEGIGTIFEAGNTFIMPEEGVILFAVWIANPPKQIEPIKPNIPETGDYNLSIYWYSAFAAICVMMVLIIIRKFKYKKICAKNIVKPRGKMPHRNFGF